MATRTRKNAGSLQKHRGITPWGNVSYVRCNLTLNSAGKWLDSDDADDAVAANDVLQLGPILPAGMELQDLHGIISNAMKASTTIQVGFKYVDGVDSTVVPQDDDYFITDAANQSSASVGVFRKSAGTAPVILPKDAYLTVKILDVTQDEASVTDFFVLGEMKGIQ